MKAVLRALRGNLRSHKFQRGLVFLTLLAAALLLAVAVTAYFSGFRVYDRLMARTHGAHIWLIVDARRASPDEIARAVQAVPEVVESTRPLATFRFTLEAPDGKKAVVTTRDLDPDRKIARLVWMDGRAPKPRSHEIALDANLARILGIHLGDSVTLGAGKRANRFTVTGTFITSEFCAYPNCNPPHVYLAPGTLAASMQREGVRPDSWDVALRVRDPRRAEEVLRKLRQALPPGSVAGYTWLEVRRYVGFDLQVQAIFVLAFGLMAVLVAGFLIANAVASAVRGQTRQIGLLRAIGFTSGQVALVYLGEYLLVGLAAALAGMALGVPLARAVFANVSRRYAASTPLPPLWTFPAILAAILGMVALAAAYPLRRIARLDTVTAIRRGAEPPRRRAVRLLRLPFPVAYGLTGLLSTPTRTLLTTLGLAVGALAITVALSLGATVREFVNDPLGLGLAPAADVAVGAGAGVTPDALLAAIRQRPEVASYACQWSMDVQLPGEEKDLYPRIVCGDLSLYANMLLEGRVPEARDEAVAAYTIAHQHGWHVGDKVTLLAQGRAYTFRIVGIYRDMNNLGQMFILPAEAFSEKPAGYFFYVRLKPGNDPHTFLSALKEQFHGHVWGEVPADSFKNDDSEMNVGRILEVTVGTLSLLLGLLTAVGVLGGLSLNVHEERRTLGVLKALGMTPGQAMVSVVAAAVGMALLGYVVGAPFGVAVAKALFNALSCMVGLGPIPVPVDWLGLALLLPGLMLMAALGAYLPARRAAQLPVVEVLREE